MQVAIHYWPSAGRKNTRETAALALDRARSLAIKHLVVASCSGFTVRVLLDQIANQKLDNAFKVVAVTHQTGFAAPGEQEMNTKTREFLRRKGVDFFTGTHFFGGFGRAVRFKFDGLEAEEMAANTLRIFGEGTKVAVEIAIMALDAGLVPYGREVVAIGGTGSGADTAIVCLPRHGKDFFAVEVREIICKPRTR